MQFTSRGIAFRLFVTCWLVYALHFATNIVREVYPALTLGDRLSFNVYEYLGLHPDIFQPDPLVEEAFINSNPGASILGSVPYALSRPVVDAVVERVNRRRARAGTSQPPEYDSRWPMAREFFAEAHRRGLDVKFGLAAGVMQAFCMAPLAALGAVVMFYLLLALTSSRTAALWLALLYALATPVLYRTAQLNQNVLLATVGLCAFALLFHLDRRLEMGRRPWYFVAGFLCGWAVVLDYSGVVLLVVLSLYGLRRWLQLPGQYRSAADPWRFAAGVVSGLAILAAYQASSFGNPFLPAQHYMPAATYTHLGYAGMSRPHLDLLWQTAFDYRFGLFVSAPLLLVALYPAAWKHGTRLLGREEVICVAAIVALFFLFCSANQYGRMQFNTGVRHVLPVVPFLFLIVAGVLVSLPLRVAAVLGAVGTYWSWCLATYREVEVGWGVFEAVYRATVGGPTLPWLATAERMQLLPGSLTARLLTLATLLILSVGLWVLWRRPRRGSGR